MLETRKLPLSLARLKMSSFCPSTKKIVTDTARVPKTYMKSMIQIRSVKFIAAALIGFMSSLAQAESSVVISTNSGSTPYTLETVLTGKSDDKDFGVAVGASGGNVGAFAQQGFSSTDVARLEFFSRSDTGAWNPGEFGNFSIGFDLYLFGFHHLCYSVAVDGNKSVLGQPIDKYLSGDVYGGSAVFFDKDNEVGRSAVWRCIRSASMRRSLGARWLSPATRQQSPLRFQVKGMFLSSSSTASHGALYRC